MTIPDLNIVYVIQAFNRPNLLAPSLLTLRNQIINRNRKILFLNDGPRNKNDVENILLNKMIFDGFFEEYPNSEYHLEKINNGPEPMFVKTFIRMFEQEKVDYFALLEDDLYYEHCYVQNIERMIEQFGNDDDIVSFSGFTRSNLLKTDDDLQKNRNVITAQHNLIGSVFKRKIWDILKEPFFDYLDLKELKYTDDEICKKINEKYKIHMPHLAYDKIVDHLCAKNKKIRASTYNCYLYHMGLIGTSCIKSEKNDALNKDAIKNFITYSWDKIKTDTTVIDNYVIDKDSDVFAEQFNREPDKFSFGIWSRIKTYDEMRFYIISSKEKNKFCPDIHFYPLIGKREECLNVLDFGCGPGRNTFELSLYGNWNIVGYDNKQMLSKSEEFSRDYYNKPMTDFKNVSFSDDWEELKIKKFDVIFCSLVLQHIFESNIKTYFSDFVNMTKKLIVAGRRINDGGRSVWKIIEECGFKKVTAYNPIPQEIPYTAEGNPEDHTIHVYEL
jgi:SAM-dependent methyltransferase